MPKLSSSAGESTPSAGSIVPTGMQLISSTADRLSRSKENIPADALSKTDFKTSSRRRFTSSM